MAVSVTGETIYGGLRVQGLGWGSESDSAALFTSTSAIGGLVMLADSDGVLGYEGRVGVIRGGLGDTTPWQNVRGNWAGTVAPAQTMEATVIGITTTDVGKFTAIGASVASLPGTLVLRNSAGAIPGTSTFYYGTNPAAFSLMSTGSCSSTSSDTSTSAPTIVSLPLGTWSSAGGTVMSITGRGSVAIRPTTSEIAGASIEAEFRAVYNVTATTWSIPDFTRLSRSGELTAIPADTNQVTLRVLAGTTLAAPSLDVHAVGQAATTHLWNGLFDFTSILS